MKPIVVVNFMDIVGLGLLAIVIVAGGIYWLWLCCKERRDARRKK